MKRSDSMTEKAPGFHAMDKWDFPWPIMDVLIGGRSSIDLPELRVASWDEATDFIRNYGYDPGDNKDLRLMHAVHIEALNFVEKHLMNFGAQNKFPPPEILYCDDIRNLLLYASSDKPEQAAHKAWSCALLRVMHTIAHIEGVAKRVDMEQAREQIEKRFRQHIFRDEEGRLWLGDRDQAVELEKVQWKGVKRRESVLLKLLHKKANVAETIYDMLGVRIVTKRLCDVLVVIKFLRQFYMVTFANCNPSRVRNTLINVDRFRSNLEMLAGMVDDKRISSAELNELLEEMTKPTGYTTTAKGNPHSASSYRSIQLTCRQLIRDTSSGQEWVDRLQEYVEDHQVSPSDKRLLLGLQKFLSQWPGFEADQRRTAFVPFEVQVMDAASYRANLQGDASHTRYKRSQIRAARRRVLSDVLKLK